MNNTNTFDKDLNPVLELVSSEDLAPLVDYLKKAKFKTIDNSEAYINYAPEHSKYADLIAENLREMGGNSFRNIIREGGPAYVDIVRDVADKLKAPYNKKNSVDDVEKSIMSTILERALHSMDQEEFNEFVKSLVLPTENFKGQISTASIITLYNAGGFASYQMTVLIANQVARAALGHGLSLAANAGLTRLASILTGPVGIAATALWTAIDLAGPAYRITIPSVIYVAMLREKLNSGTCHVCSTFLSTFSQKFCNNCGAKINHD